MTHGLTWDAAHAAVIVMILATFLLAGFVKGVIGLGLPTVAMGLLGLAMLPAQAAALLIVPSLVTNIWQLLAGGNFIGLFKRLWPMLAGIAIGTVGGAGMLAADVGGKAAIGLGVALVIYAVIGLTAVRFSVTPRSEKWLSLPIGLVTGLITAATGVFVIPAVPYLQALNLEKEELIQALGLSFTVSTIALAIALSSTGGIGGDLVGASVLALVPALAGMFIGQWARMKLSAQLFRRCFFGGLLLLGLHLASRVLM